MVLFVHTVHMNVFNSVIVYLVLQAVEKCCAELISRMKATKDKLTNPTWLELVQAAYANGVNFNATYMYVF